MPMKKEKSPAIESTEETTFATNITQPEAELSVDSSDDIIAKKEREIKKFPFEEKPGYQKFIALLNKFLYSGWYFATVAFIISFFWILGKFVPGSEVAGVIIIVLLCAFILIFIEDVTPLIPIFVMVSAMFPAEVNPAEYGLAFIGLAPLPIALIYHVIRYFRGFKIKKFFFPQLAISIALIVGGVGVVSAEEYANGIAWVLLLGALILLLYFVFSSYERFPKEVSVKDYLCKTLMAFAAIICFEVFVTYIIAPDQMSVDYGRVSLGWCIGNNFSSTLMFLIPGTLYLGTKSKHPWIYTVFFGIQYIVTIMSLSRGGILFATILLPFELAFMIYATPKKGKKEILIVLGVFVLIAIILVGVFWDKVSSLLNSVINNSFKADGHIEGSGREELYAEAWECFKTNPIFGVGIGYFGSNYDGGTMGFYFFHSTLLQIMACMGLVGIAAYVYNYVGRYKIIIKKDVFNIFILLGLLAFEGYSMIDTGTFNPMPSMIILMFITFFVELSNERGEREWPVYEKRKKKLEPVPVEGEAKSLETAEEAKPTEGDATVAVTESAINKAADKAESTDADSGAPVPDEEQESVKQKGKSKE